MYPLSKKQSLSRPSRPLSFLEKSRARVGGFLTSEKWAIGIVNAPIHVFLDTSFIPTVQWVGDCGQLEFLADCFGIVDGDRRVIMAERFSYRDSSTVRWDDRRPVRMGRGHITSITVGG